MPQIVGVQLMEVIFHLERINSHGSVNSLIKYLQLNLIF